MQEYCYHCMKPLRNSSFCGYCGANNNEIRATAPYHLNYGTLLANRYLVGKVLGEGGFGITYIGLDTTLSKRVAIKEFYPSGAANRTNNLSDDVIITQSKAEFFQKGVDRFLFEAKNVAAFSSEDGIVDVLDYFQANNTAYIVMEYLEGDTLKDCINNYGTMKADDLIELMFPVMKSLKAMHAKGVIHRDISPDNIMYTKNGKLKLMDFGSARYYTNEAREMSVVLKQGFAPEEQYGKNSPQGPFTDVYALCATIYTCITGKIPENSIDRRKNDTLAPPSALGVRIKPAHEKALMHGLTVDPQFRCRDMDTLMKEFNALIDIPETVNADAPIETAPPVNNYANNRYPQQPVNPNNVPPAWSTANNPGYMQQPPRQRSNAPIIVAIVLTVTAILAVGGVIAFIYFSDKNKDDNDEPQTTAAQVSETDQNAAISSTSDLYRIETTAPATTKPQSKESSSNDSDDDYSHSDVDAIVKSHTSGINSSLAEMNSHTTVNGYDVVVTDQDYAWISTPLDQMKDSLDDKTWYMYDSSGNLYFVYRHANNEQYRYHIHNDKVVYYIVGDSEAGNQDIYYYGDSTINASVNSIVSSGNNAYKKVFG